ncbi:chalcone isomerase family protein [Ideonella sp. A 288]|uniref:chalcone isomerase family protein n=1 Tax=Ideonella sp. A 288 TaxID=1962181 RepID=UPI000B4B9695|nr:chalcone isomerase family protein [Ideonella sp. A 288]
MRRRTLLAWPLAWGALSVAAQGVAAAPPPHIAAHLPQARLRGTGTMRFLGLHIYDAQVWSADPVRSDGGDQPLAIDIAYARSLSGERIAKRSIDEMRRIGEFDAATAERWLQTMVQLFPDVGAGDRLTGVHLPGRSARFYANGRLRGEVADALFARLFFGIWLSPRTSEPGLRAQMIGTPS